jgi:hypothetical protein
MVLTAKLEPLGNILLAEVAGTYKKAIITLQLPCMRKLGAIDGNILSAGMTDQQILEHLVPTINRVMPVLAEKLDPGRGAQWTERTEHRRLMKAGEDDSIRSLTFVIDSPGAAYRQDTEIIIRCHDLVDEELQCAIFSV